MTRTAGAVVLTMLLAQGAAAQFAQQGGKLTGSGAVGAARQGWSAGTSADGNTIIVGGPADNGWIGAAWMFTRSGGVWSQQGAKLQAADALGSAQQGYSVALSADGNTAIVGGPYDHDQAGAAWVYARSGGVWSRQGGKLVATDAIGAAQQGCSVGLSADGNTAVVGGSLDDSGSGAAWVFTRRAGGWSQQGAKLVGSGAVGHAQQGWSVAISADGNTVLVGGFADNGGVGAAWVFTRSGGAWSQQGPKLVGIGYVGSPAQGKSVAISADGNTATVGGDGDNAAIGATWVFTRNGGVWSQQGGKLVGWGYWDSHNHINQGSSLAISADGNKVLSGARHDADYAGAAWAFRRAYGGWSQQGSKFSGAGAVGYAHQGDSAALSADGGTAVLGGSNDDSGAGAAWVFVASGCEPPAITQQPLSQAVQSGRTVTLTVTATGAPLTYQWYRGALGDTSNPVGTSASTYTTPPMTSTASFWVRVGNSCGTADSSAATISVGRLVRRHLDRG